VKRGQRRPTPIDLKRLREWFNRRPVSLEDQRRAEDRIRDELRDSRAVVIKAGQRLKPLP
jgi:hypothetical protein